MGSNVYLMMETERTVFLLENEAGGWEEVSIPIGVGMLASQYFRHEPPTDGEVEHAIMVVEDALALVQDRLSVGMLLQSAEPEIRDIASLSGVAPAHGVVLPRDAVERVFNQLADVVNGLPATVAGIPADRVFAARLLILRELMHHLNVEAIALIDE